MRIHASRSRWHHSKQRGFETISEQKTLQEILVRKVQFGFPEDFKPCWNPAKPVFSQLANGAFLLLPYMEPFIIDDIRQASKHLTDPALLEEAKAWLGQEAQHFRQYRRFNEALIAAGYPQLRERENRRNASIRNSANAPSNVKSLIPLALRSWRCRLLTC